MNRKGWRSYRPSSVVGGALLATDQSPLRTPLLTVRGGNVRRTVLPAVTATRYVTPLREVARCQGSWRADDLGTYVEGHGQGVKVLVAEVLACRTGPRARPPRSGAGDRRRRPGARGGRAGRRGAGAAAALRARNLGLDYLPGALDFEAGADGVDPLLAGRCCGSTPLIGNVDRSWRNPNMLWHGTLQLIDHGAALTFHHNWPGAAAAITRPYDAATHASSTSSPVSTRGRCGTRLPRDAGAPDGRPDARARRMARGRRVAGRPAGGQRGPRLRPGSTPGTPGCRRWWPRPRPEPAAGTAPRREPAVLAGTPAAGRSHAAMTSRDTFEYAVLRVVPRIERGEALNAGVLVYCRQRDSSARPAAPRRRAGSTRPPLTADAETIGKALLVRRRCLRRRPRRRSGRAEALGSRFRWLTAPRSTVIQPGPVHTGLTEDPDAEAGTVSSSLPVLPSRTFDLGAWRT